MYMIKKCSVQGKRDKAHGHITPLWYGNSGLRNTILSQALGRPMHVDHKLKTRARYTARLVVWLMPVTPVFRRLRQEYCHKSEVSLCYIVTG